MQREVCTYGLCDIKLQKVVSVNDGGRHWIAASVTLPGKLNINDIADFQAIMVDAQTLYDNHYRFSSQC